MSGRAIKIKATTRRYILTEIHKTGCAMNDLVVYALSKFKVNIGKVMFKNEI